MSNTEYLQFAEYLGQKLDQDTPKEDVFFAIINQLMDNFDALNLKSSFDDFLRQNNLVDINDENAPIEHLIAFDDVIHAENTKIERLKEIEEQQKELEAEKEAILNTQRAKEIEEILNIPAQQGRVKKEKVAVDGDSKEFRESYQSLKSRRLKGFFDSDNNGLMLLNEAQNKEAFDAFYDKQVKNKIRESRLRFDKKEPTSYPTSPKVGTIEEIKQYMETIAIKALDEFKGAFKINAVLGIILEKTDKTNNSVSYDFKQPQTDYVGKMAPLTIRTHQDIREWVNKAPEVLLKEMMDPTKKNSSVKFIANTNIMVKIHKLTNLKGGAVVLPLEIKNNKYLTPYPFDNNLCFWAAIYQHFNKNFGDIAKQSKQIKNMCADYYGIAPDEVTYKNTKTKPTKQTPRNAFIKNYDGFNLAEEGLDFCHKHQINLRIYNFDDKTRQFYYSECDYVAVESYPYVNILVYTAKTAKGVIVSHVM